MQKPCECSVPSNALLWSLRRHRIQPSPMSLPSCYTNYSFWESVANLANTNFGLELDVESALGLATEMKRNGCACGEVQLLFSDTIDCGPVVVPQLSELIRKPNDLISDDVLPYVNAFVDASHSHTTFLLDPEVNPIAEVGTSHALVTSTPSEPGPPTKKRKATVDEVQSLLMKCTNLPRPTIYAAMQKFENKTTRSVWMNDTLDNKLDFLEDATPKKSMKDFIYWRNGPEVWFLC